MVASIALGACGSNDNRVSASARDALNPLIAQARRQAAAHDTAGAAHTLATLRNRVTQFQRSGDIAPGDATAIKHAVSNVESKLPLVTPPTTTTTTQPPPHPRPPGPDKGPGHGHGPKPKHDQGDQGD
jgi:hypothetical protein